MVTTATFFTFIYFIVYRVLSVHFRISKFFRPVNRKAVTLRLVFDNAKLSIKFSPVISYRNVEAFGDG